MFIYWSVKRLFIFLNVFLFIYLFKEFEYLFSEFIFDNKALYLLA